MKLGEYIRICTTSLPVPNDLKPEVAAEIVRIILDSWWAGIPPAIVNDCLRKTLEEFELLRMMK